MTITTKYKCQKCKIKVRSGEELCFKCLLEDARALIKDVDLKIKFYEDNLCQDMNGV